MKVKNYSVVHIALCYVLLVSHAIYSYNNRPPKLTVVMVVDQFAHHYINKLQPYFKYGLKYLLNNGVVYTNAHVPHGQPGTGVGHTGLNTGSYAQDHGIVGNNLLMPDGSKIACDDDQSPDARVIVPTDDSMRYNYGKSSQYLMVDGITDQCVMQSTPISPFRSFSISGKSRSAILTASKLGHGIWPDPETGLFTSSGAYFKELPQWLKDFNRENDINKLNTITWERMYPKNPYAYKFFDIHNYEYTRIHESLLDRPISVRDETNIQDPYHVYDMTPHANKRIIDLAQTCIKEHVSRKTKDRLLLWVCLSPLDVVGHQYGPQSLEVTDMIYHIDKQLQKLIRCAMKSVGKHNVVFALTADHGITPIPELLEQQGLSLAKRINPKDVVKTLNEQFQKTHNIQKVVKSIQGQEIVLNHDSLTYLQEKEKNSLMQEVKNAALNSPYIKNAWTYAELSALSTQPHTILDNIKKQRYKGRSGDIIIQPHTYALLTNEKEGTSHSRLPYEYNTHIPLILFNPGKFERKYVRQRVTSLQLANTLAEMLNVPKPSASTAEVLPELFDSEYQ